MCGVWITNKYNTALYSNRGQSFVLHFKKKTGIVGSTFVENNNDSHPPD